MELPVRLRPLASCRRGLVKDQRQHILRPRSPGWSIVVCPRVRCVCGSVRMGTFGPQRWAQAGQCCRRSPQFVPHVR